MNVRDMRARHNLPDQPHNQTEDTTPVMLWFDQWDAQIAKINRADRSAIERECEHFWNLRQAVLGVPSRNRQDVMAKLAVATNWGENDLDDETATMIQTEARQLQPS